MKTVKNKIKKGMTLLLAVTLLLAMGLTAHGADSGGAGNNTTGFKPEAEKGSLTLTAKDGVTKSSSKFTAYQVLEVEKPATGTQSVYEYKYTDEFSKFVGTPGSPTVEELAAKESGTLDYKITADTVDAVAAELENYVKTSVPSIKGTEIKVDTPVSNLSLGYYLILETTITAGQKQTKPMLVAIPSVTKNASTDIYEYNYNVSVTLKDQPLRTEKKIVGQNKEVDTIAKQVGEEVTFKIVQDVPKYDDTHKKITFKVVDTMSEGLTLDKVVSVKADETALDYNDSTKQYEFKETKNQDGTTTLTFDFSDHTEDSPTAGNDYYDSVKNANTVTITYTARLNKDALFGVNGNSNKVYAEFGDGSVDDGRPTSGASDYTINYAGEVEIRKVGEPADSSETESVLKDVEFTIYKESGEASSGFNERQDTAVNVVTYQRGKQDNQITTNPNEELSSKDKTGADGIARFAGLGAGTYYIKETSAPNPYILLEEPIKVVVKMSQPTSVSQGTEEATFEYVVSGDGVKDNITTNTNGKVSFTVENKKGFVLPTTGGMGTYLFTIGGALLILAAVVLILRSRKKTN